MPTLYTGKGDGGTTKTFGCDQRVSKSSAIAEALGNLDEVNSYLGLVKVSCHEQELELAGRKFSDIVEDAQQNLCIILANLAGADKHIAIEKVSEVEAIIAAAEAELPRITTFTISGGSELSASFDYARTIARRAERRVVAVADEGLKEVSPEVLKYLNRLSSLLFALARFSNLRMGVKEHAPHYS